MTKNRLMLTAVLLAVAGLACWGLMPASQKDAPGAAKRTELGSDLSAEKSTDRGADATADAAADAAADGGLTSSGTAASSVAAENAPAAQVVDQGQTTREAADAGNELTASATVSTAASDAPKPPPAGAEPMHKTPGPGSAAKAAPLQTPVSLPPPPKP